MLCGVSRAARRSSRAAENASSAVQVRCTARWRAPVRCAATRQRWRSRTRRSCPRAAPSSACSTTAASSMSVRPCTWTPEVVRRRALGGCCSFSHSSLCCGHACSRFGLFRDSGTHVGRNHEKFVFLWLDSMLLRLLHAWHSACACTRANSSTFEPVCQT